MKHNLRRVLRLTEARTFWVRAMRAWRELLPDWTPSLDEHRALETMPREHRAAVAIVADGWLANDPRWDVLMALLEWERRAERERVTTASLFKEFRERTEMYVAENTAGYYGPDGTPLPDNVVSIDEEFERMRYDSEITLETRMPQEPKPKLTLVPKPGVAHVYTVRTLADMRKEREGDG